MQAQALLSKNMLYQKIDAALQRLTVCNPPVYVALRHAASLSAQDDDGEMVTGVQRDAIVANLRLLNIFLNYRHDTFAHSVQLLDSVLSRVQVHQKFLSSIATCCLSIAAKANEPTSSRPPAASAYELLSLGQPGGTLANLLYTEQIIAELLGIEMLAMSSATTPLVFLRLFHEILATGCGDRWREKLNLTTIINNIEVLECQFEFTRFRADVLALALLGYHIQELVVVDGDDILTSSNMLVTIAELQYYCQISNAELAECRELVSRYLIQYGQQPTKLPRLRLSWSISRRTLHKMKPSTRAAQDLEPIMEDDVIGQTCRYHRRDDDEDSSPFDSELDNHVDCKDSEIDDCDLRNGDE
jgi:hypothetical protein